jgi:hypothetical protein
MNFSRIAVWMDTNPISTIFLLAAGFLVSVVLFRKYRYFVWYGAVLVGAFLGAVYAQNVLYFYTFALGMITAFAEIIGKFSDEPLKSLNTPQALFYHLSNGLIAAFALKVLYLYNVPHEVPLDQLKIVLAAGLGSMLIMRSKLFNLKLRAKDGTETGEDISFGPEQIIKVFFRFMERAIDRVRAQSRIEFVKASLDNVDFDKVCDYSLTMLKSAPQLLSAEERQSVEEELAKMRADKALQDQLAALEASLQKLSADEQKDAADKIMKMREEVSHACQLKSYRLGFLLLDKMGENFVSTTFQNLSADYRLRADLESTSSTFFSNLPFISSEPKTVAYLAYGSSMATREFSRKLGWQASDVMKFIQTVSPKKAVIKNYRVEFNKPARQNPREGYTNLVPDDSVSAEGVVYQLPPAALEFLDKNQPGYRREKITVVVDGRPMETQAYVATETRLGLKPSLNYLSIVVEGAREHHLSTAYIDSLAKTEALPVAAAATAA